MARTIAIYLVQEVSLEPLFDFLNFDDSFLELSGEVLQIRISRQLEHLWIFKDPTLIEYLEEIELSQIKEMIGLPNSSFVIELNMEAGVLELAKLFVSKIAEKYSLVIEVNDGEYLNVNEFKVFQPE